MDLPDCPPGAEGYQDSVTEVPKKPEETCTKAEQEFQDHLNSLKIRLDDGSTRSMVERRGRDISGKWIYLCYPCAAVCSGESILQTHISGRKHKTKLSMHSTWPQSIFDDHPYNQDRTEHKAIAEKVLKKMAAAVDYHNNSTPNELDAVYNKYKFVRCHIQDSLDAVKAPLIGVEYLVEHPPEQPHYEPSYMCTLCTKQGHPRTIINHLTCFRHRFSYLLRHFAKAATLLTQFRSQQKYRQGVEIVVSRIVQRVEDTYGRKKPVNIDKEDYEKDKDRIRQWLFRSHHYSENDGPTFEEVVDVDLIASLDKDYNAPETTPKFGRDKRDPSPPVVAAPSKPKFNSHRQERRLSIDSLSDISDELDSKPSRDDGRPIRGGDGPRPRYDPMGRDRNAADTFRSRYALRNAGEKRLYEKKPPNREYKLKLAEEKRLAAEEFARKTLAYHEKNPEKHPLYPEEWKKFWNRRYKEIQAEGKDPSKHDFKPEWIVFWTKRMKELHDEELRIQVIEIYRRLTLAPPDLRRDPDPDPERSPKRRDPDPKRRDFDPKRREFDPELKRSLERRRTPEPRRRSPPMRRDRRSPMVRRSPGRRSPVRRSTPHRSPGRRSPVRRSPSRRSPVRRSPGRRTPVRRSPVRRSPMRRPSPLRNLRTRSRSPYRRGGSGRRSRSPLSRRAAGQPPRNRSPLAPSLQTVLVSDDELRPDDDLSPWNSDEMESLGSSASRARGVGSGVGVGVGGGGSVGVSGGSADDVVGTLRLLGALEEHLGSLGPRVLALLGEALRLEKARPLGAEELLEREDALDLLETAKERLKGAAQAGLVPPHAAPAVRAAVVRAAATLHEADLRARTRKATSVSAGESSQKKEGAAVSVAGIGAVDRAQIAQQMAAALIAQGKTDVSSEELAQLVEAVVGMAEAKQRQAAARPAPAAPSALHSGTASALQMLQSAYDENDKKAAEKEEVPDAMDGLSDSDLETLLKNFNELSAEEQHSLIAYLKKLEAREPHRVERLRQYVSADAPIAAAPLADRPQPPANKEPKVTDAVTIESDDDDYTVEEVFKSATQKVKEDQIRQEMEIVKKSLEATPPEKEASPKPEATNEFTMKFSSASDLLALVQASIQSTSPAAAPAAVVTSVDQPRSFGDPPQTPANPMVEKPKPLIQTTPLMQNPTPLMQTPRPLLQQPFHDQQGMLRQNIMSFEEGRNIPNQGQTQMSFEDGCNMPNQDQNQMSFEGGRNIPNQGQNQMSFEGGRNIPNQGQNQMSFEGGRNIPNQGQIQMSFDGGRNMQHDQDSNQMDYDIQNNQGPNRGYDDRNMSHNKGQNQMSFEGGRNMPNNQGQNSMNFEGGRNFPNNWGPNMPNFEGGRNVPNQGQNNMSFDNNRNMSNNQGQNNMNFDGGRNMPTNQDETSMNFEGGRNMPSYQGQNNRNFDNARNMPNTQGQNQMNFDGGRNTLNNQGQWNLRPLLNNMAEKRGQSMRGHNYNQGGQFHNQGNRGNFNNANRMQDRQQFGNDNQNQNFRGRGRGGRGRGRGYY